MSAPPAPDGVPQVFCEILVVGGGLGGVAAALRAARLGSRVCLVEETGWLGGQISTQGVSALDEHRYIETFGGTASYYELREAIRAYYRRSYTLTPEAQQAADLNPGGAWVSRLAFEPRAGAAVLDGMVAGPHDSGTLQVFTHTRVVAAEVFEGRIASVLARHLENGTPLRFHAAFVLDATELGDLYPLTATPSLVGAEPGADTREPTAPIAGDRACVQHFTYPFAVEYRPGEVHTIPKPEGYETNRDAQPYTFVYTPRQAQAPAYRMFDQAPGTYGAFWTYRRALDARNFADPRVPNDVSIINWSANDFRGGSPLDLLPDARAELYRRARLLSLGFLYWLQTEAPRDDGGTGYPELAPRPDVMGSADGLSQVPYIREGRRLRALVTVFEQDIAASTNPAVRAALRDDTAGIGFYPIDLHGCGVETVSVPTKPFQIPLGSLIPVGTRNLLAAKNIGVTHVANGAYRLHPVEWAIGEAAGALAYYSLHTNETPQAIHAKPALARRFQLLLLTLGVPLYWYDDVPLKHPAFLAAQLLAVDGVWPGDDDSLSFRPDEPLTLGQGKQRVAALARRVREWAGPAAADPDAGALAPGPEDETLPLRPDAALGMIAQAIPGAGSVSPPPAAPVTSPSAAVGDVVTRGQLAIWLAAPLRRVIEAAVTIS